EVLNTIPHRYPFLMVDAVSVIEERKYAVGRKCVTLTEPCFQGHFPGHPVMPGVMTLESMAQTCAAAVMSLDEFRGGMAYFLGIDNAKFRQQVVPGNVLLLAIEIMRLGRIGKGRGQAFVNGEVVAEADMTYAFARRAENE
ncbi:MAG: 3-hydroxyacyl-ACP dehydratase FabZ, partial [Elusimicrobiaceae bacterium]